MFTFGEPPPRYCAPAARADGYANAPHHLCGHGKEARSLLPFNLSDVYQTKVDLIDRRGRREGIARAFVFLTSVGDPAQPRIDLLCHLLQGSLVTAAPGFNVMISAEHAFMHIISQKISLVRGICGSLTRPEATPKEPSCP
jgi:hypothetical protein